MATFTIRFRALLTMTNSELIENGQLVVENERIRDIFYDTSKPIEGELIDLSDCLVLPGFVNAHCHLSLSILKQRVTRRNSFTEWVKSMTKENKVVSFENRVLAMHAQANVMVRSGVTALVDFLPKGEFATEYAYLPFRQILLLEVLGFLPSSVEPIIKYLESALNHELHDNGLISYGLAHTLLIPFPLSCFKRLSIYQKNITAQYHAMWQSFLKSCSFFRMEVET